MRVGSGGEGVCVCVGVGGGRGDFPPFSPEIKQLSKIVEGVTVGSFFVSLIYSSWHKLKAQEDTV